jgi:flagellar secretion chaperone FliS
MDQKLRNFYLDTQIKNAPPGQMLIMLYDGLIDNAERAELAMSSPEDSNEPGSAANCVSRCINIVTELHSSLRPSENPELCRTLRNLYVFFTREFSEAFDRREPKKIKAILPLIRELRNTWSEAYRRSGQAQLLVA